MVFAWLWDISGEVGMEGGKDGGLEVEAEEKLKSRVLFFLLWV